MEFPLTRHTLFQMVIAIVILFQACAAFAAPSIETAIESYRDGFFEKARNSFTDIVRSPDNSSETRDMARAYLALIELAFRNREGVDRHLSRLVSENPDFDLDRVPDVSPDLREAFEQIKAQVDTSAPIGTVSGIESVYNQGQAIEYTVQAIDDRGLKRIVFEIKGRDIALEWDISGKQATRRGRLETEGWKAGNYSYSLKMVDQAGNTNLYGGDLEIQEAVRSPGFLVIMTRPTGASVFLKTMPADHSEPPLSMKIGKGEFMGKTPLQIDLIPGPYEIIIRKDGYHEVPAGIDITAGAHIPLAVDLVDRK